MELVNSKIELVRDFDLLSNYERDYLINAYKNIHLKYFNKIDSKIYHIKSVCEKNVIYEFLGKVISEYFGDKQLESRLIVNEYGRYYLITENFIKGGSYYTNILSDIFHNLKFDRNKRLDLFNLDLFDCLRFGDVLFKVNKEDLIKLKYSLKSMIINDFMRNQSDRCYRNFMFEYNFNSLKLMPLYDFEYSFFDNEEYLENIFKFYVNNENTINYVRNDEQFQELLYRAMDLDMDKIFIKLFDLYPIRLSDSEINMYKSIINDKKENIKKYNLIKK